MSKLTREQKIELYQKRKQGMTISALSQIYGIHKSGIEYLIRLIDEHGFDVLRVNKNRYYSNELKEQIINDVLQEKNSIHTTAVKYGLSSYGMLHTWIKKYSENGYTNVSKKKGRPPSMTKKSSVKKKLTDKEKLKVLEEENLYLRAENAYLKKLKVVVEQRKELQNKKNQK